MTIDWALLLLVAGASFFLGTQFRELNAERFWFLPYRERCRRYVDSPPDNPSSAILRLAGTGFVSYHCQNTVWRIRWSSRAPLSVVCGECKRRDRRVGA